MSKKEASKEFWKRADEYIAIANTQAQSDSVGNVGSSLLYAAARFNSFNVAFNVDGQEEMKKHKDEAIKFYMDQFEKMLIENLDDYIANYEKYIPNK